MAIIFLLTKQKNVKLLFSSPLFYIFHFESEHLSAQQHEHNYHKWHRAPCLRCENNNSIFTREPRERKKSQRVKKIDFHFSLYFGPFAENSKFSSEGNGRAVIGPVATFFSSHRRQYFIPIPRALQRQASRLTSPNRNRGVFLRANTK